MLTGCAGEALAAPEAVRTPTPKVDMAGRWMLSAPDKPACGMKLEGAPGEKQGAIEPEGGCPGKLFKTRHWQLAQGQLTIKERAAGAAQARRRLFPRPIHPGMPVTLKR
jgi:hypothetical protein